jgi:hypothetical protein
MAMVLTTIMMFIRVRNIEKALECETPDIKRVMKLLKKYVDEFDVCTDYEFSDKEVLTMQHTLETVHLMLMVLSYSVEARHMITSLKQMIQKVIIEQAAFEKRLLDDTQSFEQIGILYELPLDIKRTIATLVY